MIGRFAHELDGDEVWPGLQGGASLLPETGMSPRESSLAGPSPPPPLRSAPPASATQPVWDPCFEHGQQAHFLSLLLHLPP